MNYVAVCLTALVASALTLFSGFGLGTILTPVMTLFFPVEAAVAMTGLVHFANNIVKLAFFGRAASLPVVLRFGLPAMAASLAGAWLLVRLSDLAPLSTYEAFGRTLTVTPVKLLVGLLMAGFAVLELSGGRGKRAYGAAYLPLGGVVSGFFGGLSGHQGAFRSAFLLGAGLAKEAFIATGVVLACLVDATRLSVYAGLSGSEAVADNPYLVLMASLAAFAGVFIGGRMLRKTTIKTVRALVAIMLLGLSGALCLGLV
ncbi:MAG: TSUP family transporter [Thermodesulfobacteriota bacterium]